MLLLLYFRICDHISECNEMRHFYEMFVLHSTPVCPKINMLKCMQSESYEASYAFGRIEIYGCCVSLTSNSQCNRSFVGIFKRPNVTLNTFSSEISTCICTMIDSFIWIRLSRNKFFWSLDMIEMSHDFKMLHFVWFYSINCIDIQWVCFQSTNESILNFMINVNFFSLL